MKFSHGAAERMQKESQKPRSFIPVLRRRGDALVTGFNSDHQSFESAAVPECESDKNSYGELGRFRGPGQPAFEAFFLLAASGKSEKQRLL